MDRITEAAASEERQESQSGIICRTTVRAGILGYEPCCSDKVAKSVLYLADRMVYSILLERVVLAHLHQIACVIFYLIIYFKFYFIKILNSVIFIVMYSLFYTIY